MCVCCVCVPATEKAFYEEVGFEIRRIRNLGGEEGDGRRQVGGREPERKGEYRPGRIMREGERRKMLTDRQTDA